MEILEFFVANSDILRAILLVVCFVFSLLNFLKAGKINKEIFDFMYHLPYKSDRVPSKGQDFTGSNLVDQYILKADKSGLEKLETPVDIQAKIQSFYETSFDKALERLLPTVQTPRQAVYGELSENEDKLLAMADAISVAEEYRQQNNLSADLSYLQIYDLIQKQSDDLKAKLSALQKVENNTLEVSNNEKKESK